MPTMISCILLAAGLSSRFGSPKALATIHGQAAINTILNHLITTTCNEIIVVLGANANQIEPHVLNHKNIRIVYNKDYLLGQTSSCQCGLNALHQDSQGTFIWPVDFPFIKSTTLISLINAFNETPNKIIIPSLDNSRGHPPLLPKTVYQDLLNLPSTLGINTLFKLYGNNINHVLVNDPGIHLTFNTPLELTKLLT